MHLLILLTTLLSLPHLLTAAPSPLAAANNPLSGRNVITYWYRACLRSWFEKLTPEERQIMTWVQHEQKCFHKFVALGDDGDAAISRPSPRILTEPKSPVDLEKMIAAGTTGRRRTDGGGLSSSRPNDDENGGDPAGGKEPMKSTIQSGLQRLGNTFMTTLRGAQEPRRELLATGAGMVRASGPGVGLPAQGIRGFVPLLNR